MSLYSCTRALSRSSAAIPLLTRPSRRWATSVTPHSSVSDPAESEVLRCLERATLKFEEGDPHAAKELYKRCIEIRRNAISLFNLGVTHYNLKEYDEAIALWKELIALQPSYPNAHLNMGHAYMVALRPRPDLALHHLKIASSLAPENPETAFDYAAALEANGRLDEALKQYKRSKQLGIERAAVYIRNINAKILGQRKRSTEGSGKSEE
ncbi:hypothetical protein AX15_003564 [Amanita polypyramis BW_CC]|nr:hypothetical protein AX15_003564 [Amanita polypyramis BW_CC]